MGRERGERDRREWGEREEKERGEGIIIFIHTYISYNLCFDCTLTAHTFDFE